jgi:hypothetical protein
MNFCAHNTKKAGGGYLLSTHGFGFFGFYQLSVHHTFTPGRRPKMKAAPKVKGKKGEIAGGNHGGYLRLFQHPLSSIILILIL